MSVRIFNSGKQLLAYLTESRQAADAAVLQEQSELAIGDFFFRRVDVGQVVVIFGEVLDPALPVEDRKHSEAELEEYAEEALIYAEPHMEHYRFTRCFSEMCPYGELGDVHVSTVDGKISKEMFEAARQLKWPSAPLILSAIFDQTQGEVV